MPKRVAVGDPRLIQATFPAVAAGSVLVTVESERLGTTSGPFTASQVGATSTYEYQLTAAQCSLVDDLKLTFVGTVAGIERRFAERVQVAGAHYFSVAEARETGPIDTSFTDAKIEQQRFAVEDQIETNCDGTSFVPRLVKEKANGTSDPFLRLVEPYISNLVSVTEDGVDITSQVRLDGRFLWRDNIDGPWATGHRNITVIYEQSYLDYPPEDLRRKAIEATRYGLLRETRAGLHPQALSITTDLGAMRLAVAGLKAPFGLPEVDAVVLKWAQEVGTIL